MSRLRQLFIALTVTVPFACGSPIGWTVWSTTSSPATANGIDTGTITVGPDTVDITYTGEIQVEQAGGAGQTNFFLPASTFSGGVVDNAPSDGGIIQIRGMAGANTFTFASPLINPVLAIFSLGSKSTAVSYNFDATPTFVVGGASQSRAGGRIFVGGNIVQGREGNGTVEFLGTFSSLSFTVTGSELSNGFTIGAAGIAPVSNVPEPGTYSTVFIGMLFVAAPFLRRQKWGTR